MNHIYRSVWNEITRTWVAAAEIVRGRSKRSGGSSSRGAAERAEAALQGGGLRTAQGMPGPQAPPMSAALPTPTPRRRLATPAPRPMALEQRFMFDGAAAVEGLSTFSDSAAQIEPGKDTARSDSQVESPATTTRDAQRAQREPGTQSAPVLAFVDTTLPDATAVAAGFGPQVRVVMLDASTDPWQQMTQVVSSAPGVAAIHLVSHGDAQSLVIAGRSYTAEQLSNRQAELQSWQAYLAPDADLLIYGCDVGAEGSNAPLLALLAAATGADVAASVDATGPMTLGANTQLEVATGSIETATASLQGLAHTLAATVLSDANSGSTRTTAEDTEIAVTGLSITDADSPASLTLRVQTTAGTARIATLGSAAVTAGANASADFTLSGSLSAVNSALATLHFTPSLNQNNATSGFSPQIVLTARDVTNNDAAVSLTVASLNVTPVNDAPNLSTGVARSLSEGGSAALALAQLATSANVLDPDIATGQQVIEQLMMQIDSLPASGTLRYNGGVVVVGSVIPVSSLGSLTYTHTGGDIAATQTTSFNITVSDGGGGSTSGTISLSIAPVNVAPTVSGAPSLIEGQVKVVAPTINLGDSFDTMANATVVIDNLNTGNQGTFFIDADGDNVVDSGEALAGTVTLNASQSANLATQLKFAHNGAEPNAPSGVSTPSYRISVTDAGGGTGTPAGPVVATISLSVSPNNDDPTLSNPHATSSDALSVSERSTTVITNTMLRIQDADRNPADLSTTTPTAQLVYTIETRPTRGELQLDVAGTWVILGAGGRFTQADVDASRLRYVQTTDVPDPDPSLDSFSFKVRDSAFGYDVWTDPSTVTGGAREGGLRATLTGAITSQTFHLNITPVASNVGIGSGANPGPPTPGYGQLTPGQVVYSFEPTAGMLSNNSSAILPWTEGNAANATDGGYVVTSAMLSYTIKRTDTQGTTETSDDVVVTVAPAETVYTLTSQPLNGSVQRQVGNTWSAIPTYAQFTQHDIDQSRIRFVHDGSEDHIASFGYRVSDGTENFRDNTFSADVTPVNDRPTATGGTAQVSEGNSNAIRLTSSTLGMTDADGSLDGKYSPSPASGLTREGVADFLWFKITGLAVDGATSPAARGTLERWNGSAWVSVDTTVWLPSTLLSASADSGTSGLRYVHDGSEPLTYAGGPQVTFTYMVRDDLANPNNAFASDTTPPADVSGSAQSNQSATVTATIDIVPVNTAPAIADKPGDTDPTIGATIASGGATTGFNQILANVAEGSTATITSAHLRAIDPDNTTVQRQYRLTALPTLGVIQLNGKTLGLGSTFTQADIDADKLTYRNAGAEVGALTDDPSLGSYHDKFHFVVNDGVLQDDGTAPGNTFLITLAPANDKPTAAAPSTLDVLAGGATAVSVGGVSVADVDVTDVPALTEEDFIRVEVDVLNSANQSVAGALLDYTASNPSTSLRSFNSGKGTNALVLQGELSEVNAALATLTVAFTADEDSISHKIRVTVDDRLYGNTGSLTTGANGGTTGTTNSDGTEISQANNRASREITLRASNLNDAPTITNTTVFSVNEDALLSLNGFTLSDADSFSSNVTVKVELFTDSGRTTLAVPATHGALTYSGLSNVTASGTGTNTVTLTGTLANVQTALNALRYDNAADFNGTGQGVGLLYLKTTFTDFGHADVQNGNSVTVNNDIQIVPVNDAPVLAVPANLTMASGTSIDITSGFSVQDTKDVSQGATDFITVTLAATRGGNSYGAIYIQTPGAASVNGDGTSNVTVSGTASAVQAALNTTRYSPTAPNVDAVVTIAVTADDRSASVGNGTEGTGLSGTDGSNTATASFTITVSSDNDAPVVTAPSTVSVAEDSLSNAVAGVSFADSDDFGGTQRVSLSVSHGTVNLTTRTGLTVVAGAYNSSSITVSGTKANLNAALATLLYTPTANYHGNDMLTVTADDQGLTGSGGTKTDAKTIAVTVTPVNDRPTATTNVALSAVNEDSDSSGLTGTVLPGSGFGFSDATDDQTANSGNSTATAYSYFAVVGNTAIATQGTWEVSNGSGGWISVPTTGLDMTSALVFPADRLFRFVPAANFHGTPGSLAIRVADGSVDLTGNNKVSTSASNRFDITQPANGGTSPTGAWNSVDRSVGVTVTNVNDRPTATNTTLGAVDEDAANPAGATVSSLAFGYSDGTDNRLDATGGGTVVTGGLNASTAFGGIAIVGNAADPAAQGVWQYNIGSGWVSIGSGGSAPADGSALILPTSASLRFLPNVANFNGTPGSLTVRVADSSRSFSASTDISASLSATDTWSNTVTLGTSVTKRNDAPTLTHTATSPSVSENSTTGGAESIAAENLLNAGTVADIDLSTTSGLSSTVFGAGTITATLTDGISGDSLLVSGTLPTGVTTSGGSGSTPLVITLAQATTISEVQELLAAIQYRHVGDNPTVAGADLSRSYTIVLSDGNNTQSGGNAGGTAADANAALDASTTINGTITIAATNDPGSISVNNVTSTEGSTSLILSASNANLSVADPDSGNANTLSATVSVSAGTLSAVGGSGGTVSDTLNTNSVTITGATQSELNSRLQALTLAFPDPDGAGPATAANWNGSATVTVVYRDAGNTGSRPGALATSGSSASSNPGLYEYDDGASGSGNILKTTREFTVTVTNVNNAPTLTTDDGVSSGNDQVKESGLASGSSPSLEDRSASGTITLSDVDGLADIRGVRFTTVVAGATNTHDFTHTQLNNIVSGNASTHLTFNTSNGKVTLDGYNSSTGVINYSFELTSRTTDASGSTESNQFTASVTDAATTPSYSASVTITIDISDDVPSATADTDSATEDHTTTATGNVVTAVDLASGNDTNTTDGVADKPGADTATVTGVQAGTVASEITSGAGTAVAGTYGQLTISANGDYTYTLYTASSTGAGATGYTALQRIALGQTQTDIFSYTLKDADGDFSNATLTVTVSGTNDTPTITTIDVIGAATEDFSTVADNPNTGATEAGAFVTDTGSLSFDDVDSGTAATVSVALLGAHASSAQSPIPSELRYAAMLDMTAITGSGTNWSAQIASPQLLKSNYPSLSNAEFIALGYELMSQSSGTIVAFVVNFTDNSKTAITNLVAKSSISSIYFDAAENSNQQTYLRQVDVAAAQTATGKTASVTNPTGGLGDLERTLKLDGVGVAATAANGTVNWTFAADNTKLQFIAGGETLTAIYRVTVKDNSGVTTASGGNQLASRTQDITVTITGSNDAPSVDLDTANTASANRTTTYASGGTAVAFTTGDTNLADVDNTTFDKLTLSWAAANFPDGSNERLLISGASSGGAIAGLGSLSGSGSVTLAGGAVVSYTASTSGGTVSLVFTGTGGAELTRSQAEELLDALRYENTSPTPTTGSSRTFSVKATDGSALDGNTATLGITVSVVSTLSINSVTVNEGAGDAVFTVTRDGSTATAVSVSYATSSGTAISGGDFQATSGSLSFAAGEVTKTLSVPIVNDSLYEGSESFNLTLSSPASATLSVATGVGTIKDDGTGSGGTDDDRPVYSVSNASITEGGVLTFTVTRTGDAQAAQSVSYATSIGAGDTAAADDFTGTSGTLTFAQGETSKTFTVQTTQDTLLEADETLTVSLSSPTAGATLSTTAASAKGTIVNDDGAPVFSVSSASVTEGGVLSFTVTRLGDAQASQSVSYATSIASGDTAAAGDFTGTSGTLTFAQGETSKTFTVQTTQDTLLEADETLSVSLSSPTAGATLSTTAASAKGTIVNDELQVNSISVNEGSPFVIFVVSGSAGQLATLDLVPGSAEIGKDIGSSLELWSGTDWVSYLSGPVQLDEFGKATVRVSVLQDAVFEGAETLTLTAINTSGTPAFGTGTILDDGSGSVYLQRAPDQDGQVPTDATTPLDDDRPVAVADTLTVEIAGSVAANIIQRNDGPAPTTQLSIQSVAFVNDLDVTVQKSFLSLDPSAEAGFSKQIKLSDGTLHLNADGQTLYQHGGRRFDVTAINSQGTLEFNATGEANGWRVVALGETVQATIQDLDGERFRFTPLASGTAVGQTLVNVAQVVERDWRSDSFTYQIADAGGLNPSQATVTYSVTGEIVNTYEQAIDPGPDPDVDGIDRTVESVLASRVRGIVGLSDLTYSLNLSNLNPQGSGQSVAQVGLAYDGDLNGDSLGDGLQNAVTTFSWINASYFQAANANPYTSDLKAIVNLVAEDTGTSRGVADPAIQMRDIRVDPLTQQQINALQAVLRFTPNWSPLGFSANIRSDAPGGVTNIDQDPSRPGFQWRFSVDISRTGETQDTFMAFYKWVDQATIDAYRAANLPLLDLSGDAITQVGWVDFTRQTPGGDGVGIGRSADGSVLLMDYTITDNAFGDSDLRTGYITDPGMPVFIVRSITVSDSPSVAEGSAAVFSIQLNAPKSAATEIRLSLSDAPGGTDSQGGTPLDYSGTMTAHYFDAQGVKRTLTVADGRVVLPAKVTQFFVSVQTLEDQEFEGPEAFTLTATLPEGTASLGTATILDDGSGSVLDDQGRVVAGAPVTDDRPLSVNNVTASESSPFVVFTVSGQPGQRVLLALESGSAIVGTDAGAGLQFFDGTAWRDYTPGSPATVPSGRNDLLVRVAVVNDSLLEGPETFRLIASNTGGRSATGTATLVDNGSSPNRFAADNTSGQPTAGTPDNDTPPPQPVTPPPAAPAGVAVSVPPAARAAAGPIEPPTVVVVPIVVVPPPPALLVNRSITDQFAEPGGVTTFSLPADAFAHTNTTVQLSLSARQADGTPLPPWLTFNPLEGTFQAIPPAGFQGQIEIAVTARDPEGREVTAIFKFNIGQGAAAPASSGQTPAATPQDGATTPPAPGPQGRSSFTDQIRQAARREGLTNLLRATASLPGDIRLAQALEPQTREAGPGSDKLLQRILSSRAVQEAVSRAQGEPQAGAAKAAPAPRPGA